jgi:hypothetical protein
MYPSWLQTDLFKGKMSGLALTQHNSRVVVGQFFELLSRHLIKGSELGDIKEDEANPDLIVWNNGRVSFDLLLEVKASMKAHLFDSAQLDFYNGLGENEFPYTRPRLYYVLWCYHFKGNVSMAGSAYNLIRKLGSCVDSCFIVPLELIINLTNQLPKMSYGKWSIPGREYYYRMAKGCFRLLKTGNFPFDRDRFNIVKHDVAGFDMDFSKIRPFSIYIVSDFDWSSLLI